MKTNLFRTSLMLAIGLLTGGMPVLAANEVQLTSNYDDAEHTAAGQSVAASYAVDPNAPVATDGGSPAGAPCNSCDSCDSGQASCLPIADPCPRVAGYFFSDWDSWRGITSGTYPGNSGFTNGLNYAAPIPVPALADRGIGFQAGASYGVYNFSGRTSPGSQLNEVTQQMFITTGFFRRADADHRLSWGVVHDWMITDNFGVFGSSPTLAQFRGQIAWALSGRNQVGIWAAFQDRTVTRTTGALGTPVLYQGINQCNFFWDHKYAEYGADSRFYIGFPNSTRLDQTPNGFPVGGSGGSLGQVILGTTWNAPITDSLSLYANGTYMKPSAHAGINSGAVASAQEFWYVGFGVQYYPGKAARSKTIAGRTWMPYMPVANNGTFMVDASKTE